MKKVMFVVALATGMMSAKSQTSETWKPPTAATELQSFREHYYLGALIVGFGATVVATPYIGTGISKDVALVGAGVMVLGYLIQIESFRFIGRAGDRLEKKEIGIKLSPMSAGICMRF